MSDTRSVMLEFLRRLGTWDGDYVGELFADDIDWYLPEVGTLPWTGRRTRRGQIPEFFRSLGLHLVLERAVVFPGALVIDGEEAVQFGTLQHVTQQTLRQFRAVFAMRVTVRNETIVRLHLHEDTYAVALALGQDASL